ncbi:MAG: hypothetical protein UR43_C0032G0005 [candidate division TM6 bacterium GW2011_GWF2_33_332]|nr:MAG: hypothetical protein UR43_C0032G0005 [candidate division TM6 bacterium GW2011_GWF2_33_332]
MDNKALRTLFLYNGLFVGAATMLGPLYAIYVVKFVDGLEGGYKVFSPLPMVAPKTLLIKAKM